MTDAIQTPVVNSGDRDDAHNYVSIDDYRAGASSWMSSTVLAQRWNVAHPGVVTDVGVGVGGSFAVGALTRVAPGAASRLVHLTSVDSAAAIRASETLGLGRSTIYAGPESLASARR